MKNIGEIIKDFDLDYFGNAKHKITFEKMMELKKDDKVFILDLRTKEETEFVKFGFACNIPVNEVPDRMDEIPRDRSLVLFCSSATRAAMLSLYLQQEGYNDIKILTESIGDMANHFNPGYVLKNRKSLVI
jgi:rhodanese-related sulfurtransferase